MREKRTTGYKIVRRCNDNGVEGLTKPPLPVVPAQPINFLSKSRS